MITNAGQIRELRRVFRYDFASWADILCVHERSARRWEREPGRVTLCGWAAAAVAGLVRMEPQKLATLAERVRAEYARSDRMSAIAAIASALRSDK